ncbi:hypothetical protein [Aquiflexum lacus]|uniref:hypothetical protein n=1 Tax=Aquiflexum lacus TaxID=2483805 RepID=UPI00189331DD|nr:hypothetical protein [Aquiflexum lacus]
MEKNKIDEELKKIESIHWLPWIGEKYFEIPPENRMLIIGESHYLSDSGDPKKKEGDWENKIRKDLTQRMIGEDVQHKLYYENPTFRNFHKVLFNEDNLDLTRFWELVSFYNFIQRPMDSKSHRPSKEDYQFGWDTFSEVFDFLKPKYCLFIGTGYANNLNKNLKIGQKLNRSSVSCPEMINRTYGKKMIIEDENLNTAKCIFIKHTSKYITPQKWNSFLNQEMKDQLDWLLLQIKI